VFLGVNHGFGRPELFETMFFANDSEDEFDQTIFRAETREEAIENHKQMIFERGKP